LENRGNLPATRVKDSYKIEILRNRHIKYTHNQNIKNPEANQKKAHDGVNHSSTLLAKNFFAGINHFEIPKE